MLENILSLPIEKKIGQLFFIGLPGAEPDESLLETISPGGVCLFARNIRDAEQTRALLDHVRGALPVEPFLSVDQEGGTVDRLRRIVEPMPAAASLESAEEAETLAEITAEILRILGFNMNFAPVVDVIDEARATSNNGLYSRTFGRSRENVSKFASAYLEALQKNGCLGCLKHFPGLGASAVDSHEELPSVEIAQDELSGVDLFPYREIFKTGNAHAVMVAHACFPKSNLQEKDRNGKLLPASLSFNFTTKLLRDEMLFPGIVITDDLEMGAIVKNYGVGEACRMAVNAGADMLAICAGADNILEGFKAVLTAVETGEIAESRIDESLGRIAKIKALLKPSASFDIDRLSKLSRRIAALKEKPGYSHGG